MSPFTHFSLPFTYISVLATCRNAALRTVSKHVYYQAWNRSSTQVGCMRQVLRAGALGRPREMGWGGRRDGGSGWEIHVNSWLIHVNVWKTTLQYYKVISLQLIKINEKKKERNAALQGLLNLWCHKERFRPHIFCLVFQVSVGGLRVSGAWMCLVFLQGSVDCC